MSFKLFTSSTQNKEIILSLHINNLLHVFLIHLGLSEPSAAYEMKKRLVWFGDLSYSFCQHLKKCFFDHDPEASM